MDCNVKSQLAWANKNTEKRERREPHLLVPTDLSERHCSRAVSVRLLDTSCSGGRLARCLCRELLARGLASGRLSGGLLGWETARDSDEQSQCDACCARFKLCRHPTHFVPSCIYFVCVCGVVQV